MGLALLAERLGAGVEAAEDAHHVLVGRPELLPASGSATRVLGVSLGPKQP